MDGKTLGDMPLNVLAARDARNIHSDALWGSEGITLRQHYAGLCFQQFLAGSVIPPEFDASEQLLYAGRLACKAADALLAALT